MTYFSNLNKVFIGVLYLLLGCHLKELQLIVK